jgi:hypothetical protein
MGLGAVARCADADKIAAITRLVHSENFVQPRLKIFFSFRRQKVTFQWQGLLHGIDPIQ